MVLIDEITDEEAFSPEVLWAQRKESIILQVNLAEAQQDPNIDIKDTSFSLQARGKGAQGEKLYKFHLDFYKPINVEGFVCNVTPKCIDIQLTKQGEGEWWPRLLPENMRKPHFLKLDFDRWKSESDLEEASSDESEDPEMERLREALKSDMKHDNNVAYSKKFYLFLYNSVQLSLFFAIAMNCALGYLIRGSAFQKVTYQSLGTWVVFAVLLSFLETVHAFFGIVKTAWITSFMQTSGRSIVLLCLWLGGETVQELFFIWGVYFAWSTADIIRYPVYLLQTINRNISLLTWLRYHAWIFLYPLGAYCEFKIILESAIELEELGLYSIELPGIPIGLSFSLLMRLYIVVLPIGLLVLMRHMWKMRSRKYGNRRKLKAA